jgi:hypothetical protein
LTTNQWKARHKAAEVIKEQVEIVRRFLHPREGDYRCACISRLAGKRMVEIYQLFTGEMPQVENLHLFNMSPTAPAIEFIAPIEGDPSNITYVHPGLGGEPDIIQGDQDEEYPQEGRQERRALPPPKK